MTNDGGFSEEREQRKRLGEHLRDSLHDLRYTLRGLRRDPSFTALSILILALAIGANIAVFSVVNTLLLRPLPFPEAQQLVWIAPPPTKCGLSCATYSADAYEEFRQMSRVYQDVTGYEAFFVNPDNFRLTGKGEPVPATGVEVIGNFFQVLGVHPSMGRSFTPEEARPGTHNVALLSNAYWQHQFASDPGIVGKAIELNGTPITVVGVLPDSFDFGAVFSPGLRVDLFVPVDLNKERTWGNIVTLLGRLKPGVTLAQARDDAARVVPDIYFSARYPNSRGRYKMSPIPLKDYVTGKLRRSLIALWSAVGVILLIACVNLSNLMLGRAAAHAREFAIRGALGAGRGRIVRQLLTESLVLSSAGAVFGLGLAQVLLAWLAHQTSVALPLLSRLTVDSQALFWTVLIAVFTAVLFGLLPGLKIASGNLQEHLKESGPSVGAGRKHLRIRSTLVITEVALACTLLVSAGLLLRSFVNVLNVDLGFEPDHAASIGLEYQEDFSKSAADAAAKRVAAFENVLAQVTAIPGIKAAGIADFLPLGPNREWDTPQPQGKQFAPGELPDPLVYVITPGFLRAIGMRVHGRDFTWDDGPTGEKVVLINASAAKIYWPGEDAVGKVLMRGSEADRVIGVVDDVHEESVETATGGQIYYPASQQVPESDQLVVRTNVPPETVYSSLLRTLRELNPKQPAAELRPIQTIVDRAISPRRFFMLLVDAFAALGLLLATLGIYGVVSYSVTQRTQDIGVRMALGAASGRIQREVIFSTLRFALAGIALGTVASIFAARLISSLLFAASPWDASVYAGTLLCLLAVALASGYLPARRASRIDPMVALRNQ